MRLFALGSFSLFSQCSASTSRALLLQFSQFSSSSDYNSFHSSSISRRREEDSRNVRVSVWWDFENCNLPAGVNVFKVGHLITAAVRANGIKGPVQITAFGDIMQLSRANQEALSSTGINLTHIPQGGKNSADRSLLVDLMYWVSINPPPAHLFLISGDRDFASILHRLRMNNYNVLLASPESAPSVLCSAASIVWPWHALIRGENLVGKHFNQPPDGPYGSWYGHYKGSLDDPFSVVGQPSCSQVKEVLEPSSDPNPRPIPKIVFKQIRHLLKLHPKGISITELRSELGESNLCMDKDYYGYKRFSRLLLSMPHLCKLIKNSDGQFIVYMVSSRAVEPFESSDNATREDLNVAAMLNNHSSLKGAMDVPFLPSSDLSAHDKLMEVQPSSACGKPIAGTIEGEVSKTPVSDLIVNEVSEQANKKEVDDLIVNEVSEQANKTEADSTLPPSIGQHAEAEKGFFQRTWKNIFGSIVHDSDNKSCEVSEKNCSLDDSSEKKSCGGLVKICATDSLTESKSEEKIVQSASQDASSVDQVSDSSDNKSAMGFNAELLSRIGKWFKFWRDDSVNCKVSEQSGKHELLSSNSFWQAVESFLKTPRADELIYRSKTRLEIAQNLLNEGPSVLNSLSKSDLLDFVELLISDKKWVEECLTKTKPFKLTLSTVRKSSCTKSLDHSNGSISISPSTVPQPNLQESPEHDLNEKNENISETEVSTALTKNKILDKTRSEILGDCRKLICEILKEYPEGYNMGAFKRLFLERYGYQLDLQKLGYQKLASLLQIMPGVSIESTYIVPTGKVLKISNLKTILPSNLENTVSHNESNSNGESSEPWKEFSSVYSGHSRNEEKSLDVTDNQSKFVYEPAASDDDSTNSDEESLCTTQGSEVKEKKQTNEDDLLQILDSWYSNKEDESRKGKSVNNNETIDCSTSSLKHSNLSAKNNANVGSFGRKQRHQKNYSFVSDTEDNNKEKLIDGILSTLKKSSDSKMHN